MGVDSPTICALPFVHSCTRADGAVTPCCRFSDGDYIEKMPPRAYLYSDKISTVRQQMLEGKRLTGCQKCYDEEAMGRKSMRQWANDDFIDFVGHKKPIKSIEVSFNNLCNMACVMCSPQDSSKWNTYVDDLDYDGIFGITKSSNKTNNLDFTKEEYESVTKLKILGGEPFINEKNIDFIEKFNLENLHFETHTNCSVIPNERWLEVFKRLKYCDIRLSLDAKQDYASFSRYGVPWNQISATLNWWIHFQSLQDAERFHLAIHSVVHIFTIFDMDRFIWFLKGRSVRKFIFHPVTTPAYLDIKILPKSIKEELIPKIRDNYIKKYLENNIDYVDEDNLNKFLIYAERLQKREHFDFVDDIIEKIKNA